MLHEVENLQNTKILKDPMNPPVLLLSLAYLCTVSGPVITETPLDSSSLEFSSPEEHQRHLEGQSKLPLGFRVGTTSFRFVPKEVPTEASMNLTAIVLDEV